MKSIYWHDYETTGINPSQDRPVQFAGIRTDEELNIVGEPLTIYCKPCRDILPQPMACLITGITPQYAQQKGLAEPEFIARIHDEFMQPQTCVTGYNSLRFDDEVTRYTLYRNFYDPYEREWKNGNSRWDIIDMLRLTRALRPEGIEWPDNDDGSPCFKLERLTAANGIAHEGAHDALADVIATIAMARLVKEKQPKLYDYIYQHRTKRKAADLIDMLARKPFVHVSSKLPRENSYTALMMPLCEHPTNNNAIIAINLLAGPDALLKLDAESIKARVFTAANDLAEGEERIPLKAIHLNKCPVLLTPKLLDEATAKRLKIDLPLCHKHWQQLKAVKVADKLQQVFTFPANAPEQDPELALYGGFLPNEDKLLLKKIRQVSGNQLGAENFIFSDQRYATLLFRYKARFYPQALTEEEQDRWQEYRYQMLTEPQKGRLTLDNYFDELDKLEAELKNAEQQKVIEALRDWGHEIL